MEETPTQSIFNKFQERLGDKAEKARALKDRKSQALRDQLNALRAGTKVQVKVSESLSKARAARKVNGKKI